MFVIGVWWCHLHDDVIDQSDDSNAGHSGGFPGVPWLPFRAYRWQRDWSGETAEHRPIQRSVHCPSFRTHFQQDSLLSGHTYTLTKLYRYQETFEGASFPHSPVPPFPHSPVPPFPYFSIPSFLHSPISPFPHSSVPPFPYFSIPSFLHSPAPPFPIPPSSIPLFLHSSIPLFPPSSFLHSPIPHSSIPLFLIPPFLHSPIPQLPVPLSLCSCSPRGQEDWVSTWPLLILSSSTTRTGTLTMTYRYIQKTLQNLNDLSKKIVMWA